MRPELASLLELQRRDGALAESKRRLADVPKRRDALARALDGARNTVRGIQKDLEGARLERRRLEKEAEGFSAEAARLEKQLFDVKTNEEFTAMKHQIANVTGKRSDHETAILEWMEKEESLAAGLKKAEAAVGDAERGSKDGGAALDADAASLEAEIAARTKFRDEGRAPIAPAVLAKYDRLHAGREGLAVVAVQNNACGACHRALTAHDMQIAKQGETILSCEGCGRIVILVEPNVA
jgi:predicted  nucleic acid-binding Zn-ribbon protein